MPKLILLPAVDVSNGLAVRLTRGQTGTEATHGDPLDAARDFLDQGAEWLHLVDLDAAYGRGDNADVLRRVVDELAGSMSIQLSGGIRDEVSLNRALAAGVRRVNLGSAALANPDWVASAISEHGDRVVVGLDVRGSTLAPRGTTDIGADVFVTLELLESAGCSRYIVTDVDTDGAMSGPNLQLLSNVANRTNTPVIASGGIATLDDIAAIRDLVNVGVEGAILGKALYAGAFTLTDALAVSNGD
jgi:1-(5-phosphoribosyl)-5-[(5-phosphoribosylamino)methylideneamino] imidazole-4-carboxamide isomerase/N-(5'phosphoribosyl)anthranilate isomerase